MNQLGQAILLAMITSLLPLISGCASHGQSSSTSAPSPQIAAPITVVISGTDGAAFDGFYVANGVRSKISGRAPVTLNISGISQIAVAKRQVNDNLVVRAQYERGTGQMSIPPGRSDAILIVLEGGFIGSYIPAEKLASLAENAIIVIKPYWFEGTWVFDDDQVGLHREPFIAGVPEMIDHVVKDIPNARQGFRLTCSEHEFPGYQQKLIWDRADRGGNFYRLESPKMERWLCPAMFRYFSHTPKTLYVKAEAIAP
jgi:hypothetical protein